MSVTHKYFEANNIGKYYGDFQAVKNMNLHVTEGRIVGIIGPNGAGKTTFFRCLTGQVSLSSGNIWLDGLDITKKREHERVRDGIGRSFQVTSLFGELSVLDNIALSILGKQSSLSNCAVFEKRRVRVGRYVEATRVAEKVGLSGEIHHAVAALPHGKQRRLEIAMAIAGRPKILLFDEPTSGMGAEDVVGMINLLKDLSEETTIIVIEHNLRVVMELCDEVNVMVRGELMAKGTPNEIRRDSRIKELYFGRN